jgi:predicted dehydrogenase
MKTIGVGIIGASQLNSGCAIPAHIPALQALPEYELTAFSTNRRDQGCITDRRYAETERRSDLALRAKLIRQTHTDRGSAR